MKHIIHYTSTEKKTNSLVIVDLLWGRRHVPQNVFLVMR